MKRVHLLIVTLFAILLAGCSVVSTQVNEIGLEYSGGLTEDKQFVRLVPPGATMNGKGWGNTVYLYPTDQRNYRFSTDQQADIAAPIIVPSREGTRVVVEGIISFKLCIAPIDDPDAVVNDWGGTADEAYAACLQAFHENIGFKTKAFESLDFWRAMLQEFLRPGVNSSVTRASRGFTIDELLSVEALDRLNSDIARELPLELEAKQGGNFFYIADVSFEEIAPESTDVQKEYDERAVARLDTASENERGALRAAQQNNLEELRGTFSEESALICYLQIELGRELGVMPPPCFDDAPPTPVVDATP